ncbi:hypothetical protein [Tahibacter harae]|uniref:Uncharacterized protein n=1 Tax=Tahibacter harae TaxID=2963937 RepID=A0ABT1QUF2_9GAMM|nr:hypothetical protein [Tahibacter harae]MCQ4165922.1 hypothetical protein [Tahibacter harae]
MKTLIKSLLLAATLLVSAQSFAAITYSDSKVPDYLENGWNGEAFVFRITGNTIATGCAAGNEVFSVDATHPAYKIINNLTTASYVAKRKLRVVFDSGVCSSVGRAKVIAVQVFD